MRIIGLVGEVSAGFVPSDDRESELELFPYQGMRLDRLPPTTREVTDELGSRERGLTHAWSGRHA